MGSHRPPPRVAPNPRSPSPAPSWSSSGICSPIPRPATRTSAPALRNNDRQEPQGTQPRPPARSTRLRRHHHLGRLSSAAGHRQSHRADGVHRRCACARPCMADRAPCWPPQRSDFGEGLDRLLRTEAGRSHCLGGAEAGSGRRADGGKFSFDLCGVAVTEVVEEGEGLLPGAARGVQVTGAVPRVA
jgi:hypothetical protein